MKNFIALYYNTSGAHQAQPQMTEEEQKAMMEPWNIWYGKYGDRIVDGGAPCMPGVSSGDGKSWNESKNLVTGYSIVSAENLEEAKAMFEGHPIYHYPDHSIDISECAKM